MSVQFIGGKPGGGKTLLAVRIIADELKRSRRLIVTNVSLKLGELAAYCQERDIDYGDCLLSERILILNEEQLAEFYLYRYGQKVELKADCRGSTKASQMIPDFSTVDKKVDRGVLYVLDEVHVAFNSRRWQDTGAACMYYLSQHRKLSDDVVLISQSLQNVDKQMRSVGQDFTYVRNLSKETHGLFRLPSVFVKRVFLQLPTDTTPAVQTGTFRLDVNGLAKCYDTAAGVGIVGVSGADTGHKPKGLHWSWYVGAILFIIWALVHYGPRWVEWTITGGHSQASRLATAQQAHTQQQAAPQQKQASNIPDAGRQYNGNTREQEPAPQTNSVRVTGFAHFGGSWLFTLSSGNIVKTLTDPLVVTNHIYLGGRWYEVTSGL